MLTALLSDIHGNREALSATLAHARASRVDRFVVLGDIVGYGADPLYCCDTIRALEGDGALVIRGNHDAAAAGQDTDMGGLAKTAMDWTRDQLGADDKNWLANLPLQIEEPGTLFVHANGWSPGGWGYVRNAADAERSMRRTTERLTFCGHTHEPTVFHMSRARPAALFVPITGVAIPLIETRQWLAVCGAVGQPRDRNPAAAYTLFDEAKRTITYIRVPYDCESAARKISQAGLPPFLAERLLTGE